MVAYYNFWSPMRLFWSLRTALVLFYVSRPIFSPQRSIWQKCAYVSWNLAVTSWNVLSQGIGTHILFPSWSSFWVLKNKVLWFSHQNTQLSLYVWSQKIVRKGALYFQFLGIPTLWLDRKIYHLTLREGCCARFDDIELSLGYYGYHKRKNNGIVHDFQTHFKSFLFIQLTCN